MRKILYLFAFISHTIYAQTYTDYLGAGHNSGITVTTSNNKSGTSASKTIDGSGLNDSLFDASRFIAQATFGAKPAYISQVKNMGYVNWINDQFTKPPTYMRPKMDLIWDTIFARRISEGELEEDIFGPYALHFNYAFWQNNMNNQDLLRQRVAEALSEIVVISINSNLGDWGEALCSYYDMLLDESFGNYKNLLTKVSLHPAMGYYLSHYTNPKTNTQLKIRPDENYAREIMQLFTIGLYELNNDGTQKLDGNNNPIPTYDNVDIKEMAKVFTGLGAGALEDWVWWQVNDTFDLDIYAAVKTVPMKMYEYQHEPGKKYLLKTDSISAGQTGMQDINQAINFLFNHPNTGPFVSKKLIQRLVKSNPTPAYVNRVATVFNGGSGNPRGDMKAVIKAILLDPEARTRAAMNQIDAGMLRPPFLRSIHYARSMNLTQPQGRFWHNGYNLLDGLGQHVLAAPTVFNFYPPDYQPVGEIADNDLVAPEFKLHNSSKSINYLNNLYAWNMWDAVMYSWEGEENVPVVRLDMAWLETMADDPERMINELDKLLTHGQLTDQTREVMRNAMRQIKWPWDQEWRIYRPRLLVYLFMISPDYTILK
ncbi:MAG: DUF1800 domain-containing protein [Saprospiraceae bacterium]|nr:DUF1800 domain-containing protein [Saprospiraceae bacterium]MBK8632106.1 DUF1800 domain-containing protein [Saprospiraceae bacterium]